MDLPAHFELSFNTSLGRFRTIRVNNANTNNVSLGTVRAAMNSMINTNALSNNSGIAISPRRAALVRQVQVPIVLPV